MWKITADRPIWIQLSEQIARQIAAGEYEAGQRLPSVRELAAQAGVNPNTMQRAMAELEARGLVQTNRTAGRMVTEDRGMIYRTKRELAGEQIAAFIEKMKSLGFSREEIVQAVSEQLEKEA